MGKVVEKTEERIYEILRVIEKKFVTNKERKCKSK